MTKKKSDPGPEVYADMLSGINRVVDGPDEVSEILVGVRIPFLPICELERWRDTITDTVRQAVLNLAPSIARDVMSRYPTKADRVNASDEYAIKKVRRARTARISAARKATKEAQAAREAQAEVRAEADAKAVIERVAKRKKK